MTAQNKTPQCCGETLKVVKNSDGSFSYTCPKCGKSTSGKNPAEAAAVWGQGNQGDSTPERTGNNLPVILPTSPATFKTWVQQNFNDLIKDSALWIDQGNKDRPATRRMITKNMEYILNNKNISFAWETEEGCISIIEAFKDSLWYAAIMPDMGSLIPFPPVVEFNPDVQALIFGVTTGRSAPFQFLQIIDVYANDKYKCYYDDKGNFIYRPENIPIGTGGELIGIVVRGLNKISGLIEGRKYDVGDLMKKAEKHSKPHQYYLADLNLAAQMRTEGKLQREGNREYFIKEIKKKGAAAWDKKIYVDEINSPYEDADRVDMLRKVAGKNFCRPYMKVRNAAELAAEWSGDNDVDMQDAPAETTRAKATDSILQKAAGQFGCSQAPYNKEEAENIKDAEIVEEEDRI